MSSIKTTQIDGDVSVGRNVAMGGKAEIAGSVTIGHNLKVSGWLEAVNIKGVNKGIFLTVEALREAYPNPHDGWMAGVGSSTPFTAYIGSGGDWVATGGTIDITVDMTQYTEDVAQLQEDLSEVAAQVKTNESNISTNASAIAKNTEDIANAVVRIGDAETSIQSIEQSLSVEAAARIAKDEELQSSIATVSSAADKAQTTADAAQTAADNAQSTANAAQTAADKAQSTANAAQTAAENAQTAATELGVHLAKTDTTLSNLSDNATKWHETLHETDEELTSRIDVIYTSLNGLWNDYISTDGKVANHEKRIISLESSIGDVETYCQLAVESGYIDDDGKEQADNSATEVQTADIQEDDAIIDGGDAEAATIVYEKLRTGSVTLPNGEYRIEVKNGIGIYLCRYNDGVFVDKVSITSPYEFSVGDSDAEVQYNQIRLTYLHALSLKYENPVQLYGEANNLLVVLDELKASKKDVEALQTEADAKVDQDDFDKLQTSVNDLSTKVDALKSEIGDISTALDAINGLSV